MLKQSDILQAITDTLKTKYPEPQYTYYGKEIKEDFHQPCFFCNAVKSVYGYSKNQNNIALSVFLDFFADEGGDTQLQFSDCQDIITELFQHGIQVKGRFLHTDRISSEIIGEDADILQVSININYLDDTGYKQSVGYDLAKEIHSKFNNKDS